MALKCEPAIPAEQLPRLPLPIGRQRWVLDIRAREDATESEVLRAVRNVMQAWLPLFEGRPGEPTLFDPEDAEGEPPLAEPPPLTVRAPVRRVGVEFDWHGPGSDMRWPTFAQRRRQRIDPLCPIQNVDAMPVLVLSGGELADDEPLETPPDHFTDPLDLGLGPVDPDAIRRALRVTFGSAALIGGLLVAGLVVSRLRGASK